MIDSKIIPVLADARELPDLDLNSEGSCYYLRAPLGESEDGRWAVFIDGCAKLVRGEIPFEGVRAFDYFEFGFEVTLIDYQRDVTRSTVNPGESRPWIPDGCKQLAVDLACACCRHCYVT